MPLGLSITTKVNLLAGKHTFSYLKERALWGRCRALTTAPPAPKEYGKRAPVTCPNDGQPGQEERLTPHAPHNGERIPPRATSRVARSAQQGM